LTFKAFANLIVGVLFVGNPQMLHQVSRDEDITKRARKHSFKRFKCCGKM